MGRSKTPGIYRDGDGNWQVDKVIGGVRLRENFGEDSQAAEDWVAAKLVAHREARLHGTRPKRRFHEAAAKYLTENQDNASIANDVILLKPLMPYIGHLWLEQVHDDALKPFVKDRREAGRKKKTINLALSIVRRILNLAARSWRDTESGMTWLATAPLITMLPLDDQREPYQLSWAEQRKLLPHLADHLARMALFTLNSGGPRDGVVCNLRWDWEVKVPEIGGSVFLVPREFVKGRREAKVERVIVMNRVARSVIESVRGQHEDFVFTYQRRRKDGTLYRNHPIETINNNGWQDGRKLAGLDDLHVHDLRHTVGMRLREAGVGEETRADLLWHKRQGMPAHYSVAQIVELQNAIEKIAEESSCANRTLASIAREARDQKGAVSPESPQQEKRVAC